MQICQGHSLPAASFFEFYGSPELKMIFTAGRSGRDGSLLAYKLQCEIQLRGVEGAKF